METGRKIQYFFERGQLKVFYQLNIKGFTIQWRHNNGNNKDKEKKNIDENGKREKIYPYMYTIYIPETYI